MPRKANAPLLESQKNVVFRIVQTMGFDPGDFEWQVATVPGGYSVDKLVHRAHERLLLLCLTSSRTSILTSQGSQKIGEVYFSPGPEHMRLARQRALDGTDSFVTLSCG